MVQDDGTLKQISEEHAGILRRIFAAGGAEVPIYAVGDEIEIKGGRFLAFGGKLLVLEGIGRNVRAQETAHARGMAPESAPEPGPMSKPTA